MFVVAEYFFYSLSTTTTTTAAPAAVAVAKKGSGRKLKKKQQPNTYFFFSHCVGSISHSVPSVRYFLGQKEKTVEVRVSECGWIAVEYKIIMKYVQQLHSDSASQTIFKKKKKNCGQLKNFVINFI